jgi:hypothetical protein
LSVEDLDRLLAAADSTEPSSGFAAGVMEALRREQREPPPVPFPWLRLGAGLAAAVALAAMGAVLLSRTGIPWAGLPLSLRILSRAVPTMAEAALAALLSRGLSRLPRAFLGD